MDSVLGLHSISRPHAFCYEYACKNTFFTNIHRQANQVTNWLASQLSTYLRVLSFNNPPHGCFNLLWQYSAGVHLNVKNNWNKRENK
jgi:hypothetical protein